MIYTIGHVESYASAIERAKEKGEPLLKAGRNDHYPGGSVWETRRAAQVYLKLRGMTASYKVYGVLADWEQNTAEHSPRTSTLYFRDLLVDAEIVELDDE